MTYVGKRGLGLGKAHTCGGDKPVNRPSSGEAENQKTEKSSNKNNWSKTIKGVKENS
jgi:hypothetical protein